MKYEYYNPNPTVRYRRDGKPQRWHKGDCTTRALCKALDISWSEAFKLQCEEASKQYRNTTERQVMEKILLNNGFTKGKLNQNYIKSHHRRPTIREVGDEILRRNGEKRILWDTTSHMVTSVGDTLYDVWNSTDGVVWNYWYK